MRRRTSSWSNAGRHSRSRARTQPSPSVLRPTRASPSRFTVFTAPAVLLRLTHASLKLLDAVQPQAYGIYLLHHMFIIWLQYTVYDPAFPAGVKAGIVFVGTLSGSWVLTVLLRKIPVVARMI